MEELRRFRSINKIEGYSYLVLLFIAMPLKYGMGIALATKIAGMLHGLLFMAFVYQLLQTGLGKKEQMIYFILSLVPFGSFIIEKELRDKEEAYAAVPLTAE